MHFSTFIQQSLQCLIIFYGRRRKWRSGGTIFRGQHGTWQNEAAIPQIKPTTPFATGQCKTHRTDTKWNQEPHVLDVILRRHTLTQKRQGRKGRLEGKSFNKDFFEWKFQVLSLLFVRIVIQQVFFVALVVSKQRELKQTQSFVKSRYTKQSDESERASFFCLFTFFYKINTRVRERTTKLFNIALCVTLFVDSCFALPFVIFV